MKPSRWTTLASQQVYSTPVFSLHQHRRNHQQYGDHDFYVLQCPDWVNVIPITADDQIVMVHQFRHGIDDFTLEIPGGMVDPEDATPQEAARREMWEETGYDARELVALGQVHPNPAMQANRCHTYLARDARLTRKPQLDGVEEIEVVLVPRADIRGLIASGAISHALVIAAFAFLDASAQS